MTTTEIIDNNLHAYFHAMNVIRMRDARPFYNGTAAFQTLSTLDEYEGWGRCRKIIDTNSDEYKHLFNSLEEYGDTEFAKTITMQAQSATLTSYYTPQPVAKTITRFALDAHKALNKGRNAWNVLEPSAGSGHFLMGLMEDEQNNYNLYTCEKDIMTRRVLQARQIALRYLTEQKIEIKGVEARFENIKLDTRYDIIVSNIPFGKIKVADPSLANLGDVYKQSCNTIHDYYFMKAIHLLNDGGILAFITSRGFLSSPSNKIFREEMLRHGRIVSLVRLPDNLFDTIDVGSDLIIYQKKKQTIEPSDRPVAWDGRFLFGCGEDDEILGLDIAHCNISRRQNQYDKSILYYKYEGNDMAHDLAVALNADLQGIINRDKNNKQDMTTQAKPLPPRAKVARPTTAPVASATVTDASTSCNNLFSLFMGSMSNAAILKVCTNIMQRMYADLNDANRYHFRNAYFSLVNVMRHNMCNDTFSLHDIAHWANSGLTDEEMNFLHTLEKREGDKWVPADIFYKDTTTIQQRTDLTATEALAISLNTYGKVNIPYMRTLSKDNFTESLRGQIFFNPITAEYEEADRWLTGNVIEKLREANECVERYKDGERQQADIAIAALEAARPPRIPFEDIDVQLGARWVPVEWYDKFAYYAFGEEYEDKDNHWRSVTIEYVPATDDYIGNISLWGRREWQVKGQHPGDMFFYALRGTVPNFTMKNEADKSVKDEEAIRRGLKVIDEIRKVWKEYINAPQNMDFRTEIEEIYNNRFNCEVRPQYNGEFQTFPDLRLDNLGIKDLYKSQKDAIWMIKRNGGGVCWHEVGTGKTLIMCIAAYEMKRIGMCNKPMIIGLKANIAQIADTFSKAYPNGKLLFPKASDFSKENRIELFNQIKNNDWDCIIMTHEQFGQIPAAEQTEMSLISEKIDALNEVLDKLDSTGKWYGRQLRGLQQRRDKLMLELDAMRGKIAARKDKVMDFCEMGIDHIFVDESHYFKNLGFATRYTRVAGIGNSEGSQRAFKLQTAIYDIQRRKGRELCATFLSGTIVSNSLTELYNIFNYLRPESLKAQCIHSFDAWAAVFCEKTNDYEVNIVGQIHTKERFSTYINMPELSRFLTQITDYRTASMINLDVPRAEQHFESAPPTIQQQTMLDRLVKFVGNGKWAELELQRECPKNLDLSLMLVATNVARQTALDPRMLDDQRSFGDEDNCKVRRCAANIYRIYKETQSDLGTQFVFNDISTLDPSKWNMQQELHDLLVREYGIPSSQIAFINNAATDKKRLELFDRMNRGEVRVLIGSTQKLGTGVNAQERAVAIHHLDIPWRPSDMEQRNGRAIRKGNWVAKKNGNKVDIYIYATERTLDAYKFSLLKNKQAFIDQLNNGTLGVRRIDESVVGDGDKAVSYAEFLSILSGNDDLLTKAKLDAKIMALEKDKTQFFRQRNQAVAEAHRYETEIKTMNEWMKLAKYDIKHHTDVTADTIPMVQGKSYTTLHDAGRELTKLVDTFHGEDYTIIGQCGSLKLAALRTLPDFNNKDGICKFYIVGASGQYYACHQGSNNTGIVIRSSYENVAHYPFDTLTNITKDIDEKTNRIADYEAKLPALQAWSTKEWQDEQKLQDLYKELEEVKARIEKPTTPKAA